MSAQIAVALAPARHPAAYTRISDDRSGENASIARQRELIVKLADREGIDPATIVWYEDKSRSASHGTRPRFGDLMADMQADRVSVILVWVADRLWRNDEDLLLHVIPTLRKAAVTVKAAQGNDLDVSNAESRMTTKITGAISGFETERKAERVQIAAEYRAKKGRYSGGVRLFGYEQRGTQIRRKIEGSVVVETERPHGPLTLVPEEAEAIASGYRMILAGASLNAVTRDWRARGLTGVKGGPLVPLVVRDILLRASNAGLSSYKGEVVGRSEWPAIVDADTWANVKAILTDPKRRSNAGRPAVHLLSGILHCHCGQPMRAAGAKRGRQQYRCRAGRQLPDPGTQAHASRGMAKLDAAVTGLIVEHIITNADRLTRPDYTPRKGASVAKAVAEASKLRGVIEAYQNRAAQFAPDDLAALLRNLRADLALVESRIVKAAGTPATQALVAGGDVRAGWLALSTESRRTVIKEQVERIVVGPGKQGSRSATLHNIDVRWRD